MDSILITRRRCVQGLSVAGLSCAWGLAAARAQASAERRSKACILIFLEGGPSHIDTFDPKPGAKTNGPFEAIDTKLTGVKFSQHLPQLAQQADKLAVVRSLTSPEGDHERAASLLHTGYQPNPRLQYPSLGASVSKRQSQATREAPPFVAIGAAPGSGILGPQYGPFVVQDVNNPAPSLALPDGFAEGRMQRRIAALEQLNREFGGARGTALGSDLTELTRRADSMRRLPVFQPYDPAESVPELFERYGGKVNDGYLARACLLARRLVEAGVSFVEIQYSGWDTHADNFNQVQTLSASLDPALATLIQDLVDRDLLDTTLVACFGEFGRTPVINGNTGRDHYPNVFSALLAGGGLKTGQVVGSSDADGAEVKDRPMTVPDLHATLYTSLGIDIGVDDFAPDGRLLRLTNGGKPVAELLRS